MTAPWSPLAWLKIMGFSLEARLFGNSLAKIYNSGESESMRAYDVPINTGAIRRHSNQ